MIGNAPDPDKEDEYEIARQFPITYKPDNDPEVQEETVVMELQTKEAHNMTFNVDDRLESEPDSDGSLTDSSDSGAQSASEMPCDSSARAKHGDIGDKGNTKPRELSPIDKVCGPSSISSSDVQRQLFYSFMQLS